MSAATTASTLSIGIAGWDYPDWAGFVYPVRPGAGFDKLAWVSQYVDVIEINSSFYRPIRPEVAESWVRRTADREPFSFTAKVHRSWTHDLNSDLDSVIAPTLQGLKPLREAGILGALLLQFPQSFWHSQRSLDRLQRIVDPLTDWTVVVEVRHTSWENEETLQWLSDRDIGWCLVDQPDAGPTTIGPIGHVTSSLGYARFHGRNVGNWFRSDAGRDQRYDYLYSPDELTRLTPALEEMSLQTQNMFVILNNHFQGQALANALQLKQMMQGGAPDAPLELVAKYPELGSYVSTRPRGLF